MTLQQRDDGLFDYSGCSKIHMMRTITQHLTVLSLLLFIASNYHELRVLDRPSLVPPSHDDASFVVQPGPGISVA